MKSSYILATVAILAFSSCKRKVGESTIDYSIKDCEIFIEKMPHGKRGIEGFTVITYPEGFSFQKLDEAVYEILTSKNFDCNLIKIYVQYSSKDKYGRDSLSQQQNVGSFDITEAKKYVDFTAWNKVFSVNKLIESENLKSVANKIDYTVLTTPPADDPISSESNNQPTDLLNPYELKDFYPYPIQQTEGISLDTIIVKGILTHYKAGQDSDSITIETEDGITDLTLHFNSLKSGKTRQSPVVPIQMGDKITAVCVSTGNNNGILLSARVNY